MDNIELQAIIFQYTRAYDRMSGKALLETLQKDLPEFSLKEIAEATLSIIQQCFPEDKQLSDYMKSNMEQE